MNTAPLKSFAIQSRNILKQGVLNKILELGFDLEGNVRVSEPSRIQGGSIFMDQIKDEGFYEAWMELKSKIVAHGIKEVCEEAAYTWFNRMIAIRIMQKNHFIEPVMEYVNDESRVPVIVAQARAGRITIPLKASVAESLNRLLADPTRIDEQFKLLIEAFCESNPVIFNCFGGIEKFVSILLPDNILSKGGFVDLLNSTSYLTDEDYTKSELIGWLYQFYISEKKDEVFASKAKVAKEDIPAATQIFTPNWIVKYMVQNTIGRIYLDNNPDSPLGDTMEYLVKNDERTSDDDILKIDDITDYKMIDPACGSGHILNEGFDLLYDMYMDEFYSPKNAIENIFRKNLIGIDIDTRAKQLATFALLMKAAQRDRSFLDARVMPRVLDMPEPFESLSHEGTLESYLPHYFLGADSETIKETADAFELLRQSKNLGSIMKFEISDTTRYKIEARTAEWKNSDFVPDAIKVVLPSMDLILALTDKYTAVVANPPYMGGGNMNKELSKYVESNYKDGKADLFSVFMLLSERLLAEKGKYGMINMQSWMFLSSFENLRKHVIRSLHIDNMLHLGPRTFDELSGEVVQNTAFVLSKHLPTSQGGDYYRLVDGKNCADKEQMFRSHKDGNEDSNHIYYPNVEQKNFEKIPGAPIGYWVSEKASRIIENSDSISAVAAPKQGLATGDNNRFLRFIWEIDDNKRGRIKWIPCTKGGAYRKWYGNIEYCVNWEHDGYELKNFVGLNGKLASRPQNQLYYFKQIGCTWSTISSGKPAFRFFDKEWLFETKGSVCFPKDTSKNSVMMAYLNSPLVNFYLRLYSPTMDYHEGPVGKLPFLNITEQSKEQLINNLSEQNIAISKLDWDAHETSWDFQCNELLSIDSDTYIDNINYEIEKHYEETGEHICIDPAAPQLDSLEWRMEQYKTKWERNFMRLHKNEEELNRQFIDIYGLQDELTPDVPFNEITILQQGEISIKNNAIVWNDDVIIKQLISYAVGCWMGRYRLDKPGLNIAYYPDDKEICSYKYNGKSFTIDDDGIIPLMGGQNPFEDDNAIQKMVNFVHIVFGDERLTENLNFIEHSLGKSIEDYLIKDFWKDHKKMYQNRPIYWLFSSKKGAFQVLVYMHRMNPYTAEKVRTKYLLPYIEYLQTRIQQDNERGADLTTIERKNLTKMEAALVECQEYHDRLHSIADKQINFDLDDGVVVNYAKFGDVLAKIK